MKFPNHPKFLDWWLLIVRSRPRQLESSFAMKTIFTVIFLFLSRISVIGDFVSYFFMHQSISSCAHASPPGGPTPGNQQFLRTNQLFKCPGIVTQNCFVARRSFLFLFSLQSKLIQAKLSPSLVLFPIIVKNISHSAGLASPPSMNPLLSRRIQ